MSAPQDKNTEELRAQEEEVQETKEAENLNENAEEETELENNFADLQITNEKPEDYIRAPQAAEDTNTEELRAQEEKVQETKEAENLNENAEEEVQEIREQKLYDENVEEQTELVKMVFADLQQIIKDEILNIKEKQKAKNKEAEDYIKALQKTSVTPPTNNRPLPFPSNEDTALSILKQLKKEIKENEKKFLAATKLKAVKNFTVEVTFNDRNQEMYDALSKGRDTFTKTEQNILGRPIFSSGQFYFEVDVKGKEFWGVGVAEEESAERTGYIEVNPKNGFWMISRKQGDDVTVYRDKSKNKSNHKYVDQPEFDKVGVFVDFDEGLVEFYNVDTPDIIHTFRGESFLKLRPLMV